MYDIHVAAHDAARVVTVSKIEWQGALSRSILLFEPSILFGDNEYSCMHGAVLHAAVPIILLQSYT